MTKVLGILVLAALAIGGYWLLSGPQQAPTVAAVRVERADIANILTTNGRIEAAERFEVIAGTAGRVLTVPVSVGDAVRAGQTLATIDAGPARSERAQAQARLEAAQAKLRALEEGLPPAERADLEIRISALQGSIDALLADRAVTKRLVERQAAPRLELAELDKQLLALRNDQKALQQKLQAQPVSAALDGARASVREAEAAVELAERDLRSAAVRAPATGRMYSLAVRPGEFVALGALVARIAGGGEVEAAIFVDEPEIGRVRLGAEARLTADAYPERSWTCTVERLPTEIIQLDTRRVGEIRCLVAGDAEGLIPNLTVDIAIRTNFVADVPSLPREAVQRDGDGEFVWTVDTASQARRTRIETGVRSSDRIEIRNGVTENQAILLPGAETLNEGQTVSVAVGAMR